MSKRTNAKWALASLLLAIACIGLYQAYPSGFRDPELAPDGSLRGSPNPDQGILDSEESQERYVGDGKSGSIEPATRQAGAIQIDAIGGSVSASGGAQIAGAKVHWESFLLPVKEASVMVTSTGYPRDPQSNRTTICAADGRFTFESGEAASQNAPNLLEVLTVVADGYQVDRKSRLGGAADWTQATFVLTKHSGKLVTVLDSAYNPIQGAVVKQNGFLVGGMPLDRIERIADSFYQQERRTDAGGQIALPHWNSSSYIHVEYEGATTARSLSHGADPLTIVLSSTVAISGSVLSTSDPWTDKPMTLVVSNEGQVLATIPLKGLGAWGPIHLAVQEDRVWSVEVEAPGSNSSRRLLEVSPGTELTGVDIELGEGVALWCLLKDANEDPLEGFTAKCTWSDEFGDHAVRAISNQVGAVEFPAIPNGEFLLEADTPGIVSDNWVVTLPAEELWAYVLTLYPAGSVRGRCTLQGKPCTDFEVRYDSKDSFDVGEPKIFQSVDGTFDLGPVPLGRTTFLAVDEYGNSSAWVKAEVIAAGVELELELKAVARVLGRVVDGAGKGIGGATVQRLMIDRKGGPISETAFHGEFEIGVPLGAGTVEVVVEKEGYSTRTVEVRGDPGETLVLPDVSLLPTVEVVLELELPKGMDTGELFGFNLEEHEDLVPVGPDGVCLLPNQPLGNQSFGVALPDGSAKWRNIQATSDGGNHCGIDLRSVGEVDVALLNATEEHLREGMYLELEPIGRGTGETRATSTHWVYDEPSWKFQMLEDGAYSLRIEGRSERALSSKVVVIQGGQLQAVELDLNAKGHKLQLVDAAGNPRTGADVVIQMVRDQSVVFFETDSDGMASLVVDGSGPAKLFAWKTEEGCLWNWPIEIPEEIGSEAIRVVMANDAQIPLRVESALGPVSGQMCTLLGTGLEYEVVLPQDTDVAGRARFDWLSPGDFQIVVLAAGHWPYREVHRASAGGPEQEVFLRRTTDLSIEVQNASGAALAGVPVTLQSYDLDESAADWQTQGQIQISTSNWRTGGDGRIRIEGLPEGRYRCTAQPGPGSGTSVDVEVAPGAENLARIKLPQ